jgi:hypothetical protein
LFARAAGRGRPGDFLTVDQAEVIVRSQFSGQDCFTMVTEFSDHGKVVHVQNTIEEKELVLNVGIDEELGIDVENSGRVFIRNLTINRIPIVKHYCDMILAPVVRLKLNCNKFTISFMVVVSDVY